MVGVAARSSSEWPRDALFLGAPHSANVIQATLNLTPPVPWQAVFTKIADANGVWQFTQTKLTISPQFYRSHA